MLGRIRASTSPLTIALAFILPGLLTVASACGSDVTEGANGDTTSSSGGYLDRDCYERCLALGGTEAKCKSECWVDDGTGGGSSSGSSSGTGGAGTGLDKEAERECYECMAHAQKLGGVCSAEWNACNESLACKMLLICPYECYGDEDCIKQCHEIIPTGVETITALILCMVCDDGPCGEDCQNSIWQQYCQ